MANGAKQYQMSVTGQLGAADTRKRAPPSPAAVQLQATSNETSQAAPRRSHLAGVHINVHDIDVDKCLVEFKRRPQEFAFMVQEDWIQLGKNVGMIGTQSEAQRWYLTTATKEGDVVGTLLHSEAERSCNIAHTSVKPMYRSVGVGTSMVRALQQQDKRIHVMLQDCVKAATDFYCVMCRFTPVPTGDKDGPMMLFWDPKDGIEPDPVSSRGARVAAMQQVDSQLEQERRHAAELQLQAQEQRSGNRYESHQENVDWKKNEPVRSHKTKKRTSSSPPPSPYQNRVANKALARRKVSDNSLTERALAGEETLNHVDGSSTEIRRTALNFDGQEDEEAMCDDETGYTSLHSLDSSISLMDTSDEGMTPEDSTTKRRMRPPLPQEDVLIKQHLKFLQMPFDNDAHQDGVGWTESDRAQARIDT